MFKKLDELHSLIDPDKPRKRLALAVSQDPHSLEAVNKAFRAGLIEPVLVGSKEKTLKLADEMNLDFKGASFIDEHIPEKAVETAVRMVHDGRADVLMKGQIATPVL